MDKYERFKAFGFCEMTQINPERNRYRYYSISIQPGLFEISVQRGWGRVGCKPRIKNQFFADLQEAVQCANRFYRQKSGRGYQEIYQQTAS